MKIGFALQRVPRILGGESDGGCVVRTVGSRFGFGEGTLTRPAEAATLLRPSIYER